MISDKCWLSINGDEDNTLSWTRPFLWTLWLNVVCEHLGSDTYDTYVQTQPPLTPTPYPRMSLNTGYLGLKKHTHIHVHGDKPIDRPTQALTSVLKNTYTWVCRTNTHTDGPGTPHMDSNHTCVHRHRYRQETYETKFRRTSQSNNNKAIITKWKQIVLWETHSEDQNTSDGQTDSQMNG